MDAKEELRIVQLVKKLLAITARKGVKYGQKGILPGISPLLRRFFSTYKGVK
jgi:hypothetical protein